MFWNRSLVQIAIITGVALLAGSVTIVKSGTDAIAQIESTQSFYPASNISRSRTILAQENQRRTALIIGNSNYRNQGILPNPLNDANDMAEALAELGFEVIKVVDGDRKAMDAALEKFTAQLDRGDVALFYYAGHGIQVDGENYLIPVDAVLNNEKDVSYEALPVGKVQNVMENIDVKIIILDACRNNPFGRRWTRSTQNPGLAQINGLTGSFIAFATSPGKYAEDGNGKNGTFTSYILKYIKMPNLSIDDLFKQVRQDVSSVTDKRQVPWVSTSLIGDFSFNLQSTTTAVNTPTPTPQPTNTPTPPPSGLESNITPNGNDNSRPTDVSINTPTPTPQPTNTPTPPPSGSEPNITPNGNDNLSRKSSSWAEIIANAPQDRQARKTYYASEITTYVERGGDPNTKTDYGDTLLQSAAKSGDRPLVDFLLTKGADINAKGVDGGTVLHYAAEIGDRQLVELLLTKGSDLKAKGNSGDTILQSAARSGDRKLIEFLLAKKLDINAKNSDGVTALYYAAESNDLKLVEFLLTKGANINIKSIDGNTVLHYAAGSGNRPLVELLLAKGASVNGKNNSGKTSLDMTLESDFPEITQILKKRGAVSSKS
jgi:ankyrin repeat protein